MRRGVGLHGLRQNQQRQTHFQSEADRLSNLQLDALSQKLAFFKDKLQQYAITYRKQINKNPELRYRFREMCREIGVDPLASSKGFWSELLGVGSFYYELAIQVVEVCYRSRAENGGLMKLREVHEKVKARRERYAKVMRSNDSDSIKQVSLADIQQAIQKLKILGAGFSMVTIGNETYVQSVPYELNKDHSYMLNLVQRLGVEQPYTVKELGTLIGEALDEDRASLLEQGDTNGAAMLLPWSRTRVYKTLDFFLQQGIVWLDQPSSEAHYYFVSLQGDLFTFE